MNHKAGIYVFRHKRLKLAYVGLSVTAQHRANGHFRQISGKNKLKTNARGNPTKSKQAMADAVPEPTLEAAHATFSYSVVETMPACYTLLNAAEKRWEAQLIAEGYALYNTDPCGQSPIKCSCCKDPIG